jgi:hypothetical protein
MVRPNPSKARLEMDFQGYRAVNRGSFFVPFPVEEVFPLYGPVKETNWAPGWEPQWLYPAKTIAESSVPEPGWTFITGSSTEKKLWYIQNADFTLHEISYIVLWPERMVYRIDINARPSVDPTLRKNGTSTAVKYDFVGISEGGNAEVMKRTGRAIDHAKEMEHWRQAIQGYLEMRCR